MDLQFLVDEYLEEITELNYGLKTIERYKYVLGVFSECILYCHKIDNSVITEYLNGISITKLFDTVDFYVNVKHAISEYTIRLYISVISEFLKFIKRKQGICNDVIIQSFGLGKNDENSFYSKVNRYIQDMLDKPKQCQPPSS